MNKLFGYDFYSEKKEKVKADKFSMQDDSDKMLYEQIHQNARDKKPGWNILHEDNFTDKYGNVFIFLRWTENSIY